jgi:uncharacterized protein YqeY
MQEQIKASIKACMMAKEMEKLQVMRGVSAALTTEMVSEQRMATGKAVTEPLTDEECVKVIKKLVKQRKDSIEQFVNGGREDLADDEKAELAILETLLPAQMTRDQIVEAVKNKIAEMGEIDITKKGMITGMIIKSVGPDADGSVVKEIIDELLK